MCKQYVLKKKESVNIITVQNRPRCFFKVLQIQRRYLKMSGTSNQKQKQKEKKSKISTLHLSTTGDFPTIQMLPSFFSLFGDLNIFCYFYKLLTQKDAATETINNLIKGTDNIKRCRRVALLKPWRSSPASHPTTKMLHTKATTT